MDWRRGYRAGRTVGAALSTAVAVAACGSGLRTESASQHSTEAPSTPVTVTQTVVTTTTVVASQRPVGTGTGASVATKRARATARKRPTAAGRASPRSSTRTCYPTVHLAGTHIPATTIPATTIPATSVGGVKLPAVHLPATRLPAVDLPPSTLPGGCVDAPQAFSLPNTTIRTSNYSAVDPKYAAGPTQRYWAAAGPDVSVPDPTAPGFGQFNAAGFPKNQYVRPYIRSDGTVVSGYWRNDPTDGLPTCDVINC